MAIKAYPVSIGNPTLIGRIFADIRSSIGTMTIFKTGRILQEINNKGELFYLCQILHPKTMEEYCNKVLTFDQISQYALFANVESYKKVFEERNFAWSDPSGAI